MGKTTFFPVALAKKGKNGNDHIRHFLICMIYLLHRADLIAQDTIIWRLLDMRKEGHRGYIT